jgi:hypothetical protein
MQIAPSSTTGGRPFEIPSPRPSSDRSPRSPSVPSVLSGSGASEAPPPPAARSPSRSAFRCWQCGQTHSRDLVRVSCHVYCTRTHTHSAASRLRSLAGYSTDPTPMAASPLSGKNPCSPIMAKNIYQAPTETHSVAKKSHQSAHPMPAAITPHGLCVAF